MKFMHRQRPNRIQHVGASVPPDPSAPVFISPPTISGGMLEGSILTVSPGLVSGYPASTRTYQWKAEGVNISGQTSTGLDTTGHVGETITATETATNSEGAASSTSAGFGPIEGVSGAVFEEHFVNLSNWSFYSFNVNAAYVQSVDASIAELVSGQLQLTCPDDSKAYPTAVTPLTDLVNGATYQITSQYIGDDPLFRVGTDSTGEVGGATLVLNESPGTSVTLQTFEDTFIAGLDPLYLALSVSTETSGIACKFDNILIETLIEGVGPLPVNTIPPALTGIETEGETLTVSNGTWDNSPTSYARQWFQAELDEFGDVITDEDDAFLGTVITDETNTTLDTSGLGLGNERIFAEVIATNAAGSTMAQSNVTGPLTSIAWTPASLGSGVIAFYDAQDSASLSLTGSLVNQMSDLSGNGHHLTASGSARLTYGATSYDGGPGITSDLSPVAMTTAANSFPVGGTTLSGFMSAEINAGNSDTKRMMTYTATGQAEDYDNASSAAILLVKTSDNGVGAYRDLDWRSAKVCTLDDPHRMASVFDGTNNTVYVNNVAGTPVVSAGTFAALGVMKIGGWKGITQRILVMNRVPTSDERTLIDTWLQG